MIGALDQRVTLRRRSEVSDGMGGVAVAWSDIGTVWAGAKAKGGREALVDGRVNASFVVVFTIYNRDDISEVSQILWGGVPYNIRGIMAEGARPLTLKIEAERGVVQ